MQPKQNQQKKENCSMSEMQKMTPDKAGALNQLKVAAENHFRDEIEKENKRKAEADVKAARDLINQRNLAAYLGQVMASGGMWLIDGKVYQIPAAPKWVYTLMAKGIAVQMGAWGKTLTGDVGA